jgi:hypothetical protein
MGKIDTFLGKWASRKLLVFFIATLLSLFGNLDSHDWVTIASIYIGSQAVVDLAKVYKSKL